MIVISPHIHVDSPVPSSCALTYPEWRNGGTRIVPITALGRKMAVGGGAAGVYLCDYKRPDR